MAELLSLHLQTTQLERMQEFYVEQMGMSVIPMPPCAAKSASAAMPRTVVLAGPQRLLLLSEGKTAGLVRTLFAVRDKTQWLRGVSLLNSLGSRSLATHDLVYAQLYSALYDGTVWQVTDPEGNCLCFGQPSQRTLSSLNRAPSALSLEGRLQHMGLGTRLPKEMQAFYLNNLRFALSDEVFGEDGELRSSFMRTNHEHHSIAVFGNNMPGFDHMSFEVSDWNGIKIWADHFASFETKIFWGPGRHGAGNNLFIFVYDPDKNMLEISSELQTIAPNSPAGRWDFNYKAYNLWGPAALRV